MSLSVGIDLGTTRCAVGVMEAGKATTLLVNRQPYREPSVIGHEEDGSSVIGERARRLALTRPREMMLAARRLLGRRFDEVDAEAWRAQPLLRAENGDVQVKLGEHTVSTPELLAPLLRQVRQTTEAQLGETIPTVVVAVRGQLRDLQRRATLAACRLGGLEPRRLIHTTTAAALVYHATRNSVGDERIAVIDFGGGGFDVALIEVGDRSVEVLAQRGVEVGGEDLDARMIEWLLAELREQTGIDGAADPIVRARMRDAAEKARIALSEQKEVVVHLPYLAADEAGPKHLASKLTQKRFEKLVADLLDRCAATVQRALDEAGRPIDQFTQVLFIGGCTRMPALHERVATIFKKEPSAALDSDDVVARGAAIFAGLLASRSPELVVHEALSRPLWLQVGRAEPRPLFPPRSPVPTEHSEPLETPGDGRPGVECRVLEGERAGGEAPLLLKFTVAGRPEVETKFTLDGNQVLDIAIREMFRGKEARLVIEERGGLEGPVLAAMIEAARAEETEARAQRAIAERRQRLEGMAQRAERVTAEMEKLSPELRAAVTAGVRDARAVLQTQDDELVTAAIEAFAGLLRPLPGELAAIAAPPAPTGRLQPVPMAPPKRVVASDGGEFIPDDPDQS
ncbi:MAG TPA: Hsp70 family protein [Nannocystis sp.]|jgi:molecular chaperone DnaK